MEEIGEKTPTAAATHEAFSMHRMPLQMLRKRPRQDAKRVRACLVESQRAPCRSGGDRAVMEQNLGRMLESVNAFLDVARVESNPMSEYHISS